MLYITQNTAVNLFPCWVKLGFNIYIFLLFFRRGIGISPPLSLSLSPPPVCMIKCYRFLEGSILVSGANVNQNLAHTNRLPNEENIKCNTTGGVFIEFTVCRQCLSNFYRLTLDCEKNGISDEKYLFFNNSTNTRNTSILHSLPNLTYSHMFCQLKDTIAYKIKVLFQILLVHPHYSLFVPYSSLLKYYS